MTATLAQDSPSQGLSPSPWHQNYTPQPHKTHLLLLSTYCPICLRKALALCSFTRTVWPRCLQTGRGRAGQAGGRAAEVALTKWACGGRPRAPKHAAWQPGLCSAWPPAACSACHANTPGGRVAHCQQALQGDATGAHQVLAQHRLQHRLRRGNEKSVVE